MWSYLVLTVAIVAILVSLTLAAVQRVRESAARLKCQNNVKQLALALHQYHDANNAFPPGHRSFTNPDHMPFSGWPISILPFVEQRTLYEQGRTAYRILPLPFINPPHSGLSTVVQAFLCPTDPRIVTAQVSLRTRTLAAFTSYLGIAGSGSRPASGTLTSSATDGVLFQNSRVTFLDVTDGTTSTLLLGERPPSADFQFGWWYAGVGQRFTGHADMILSVREPNLQPIVTGSPCGPGNYPFMPASGFDDPCGMFHFWSPHPGGANFAFCDGSVRFLAYSANPLMPALATRAGGEAVSVPE
jgi:prepilin-type processing-associated H-X9-DG protein